MGGGYRQDGLHHARCCDCGERMRMPEIFTHDCSILRLFRLALGRLWRRIRGRR